MITANVTGKLAFDARVLKTKTGKAMTSARMACNDNDGATLWVDLLAFDLNAEWLSRCAKGDRVSAMGTLKLNQWQDKRTGESKECLQLVVDNMLSNAPKPRKQSSQKTKTAPASKPVATQPSDPFKGGSDIDENALPF